MAEAGTMRAAGATSLAAPGKIPPRPARDQRLDLVRGWLQLTIFASHVMGSFIGGWMIHGSWGLSDSSEQFVFLSGFTLGSVFARKAARDGWRAGAADMTRRVWRLYRIHLMVFALFGLMVGAAGASFLPGEADRLGWTWFLAAPAWAALGMLTMLYQPAFMGILPVFVWCMLLLPGFAAMEARWGGRALALPMGCYAAVWLFGLSAPSLWPDGGIAFNPFAWQMLFLAGAWLGRRALMHGRALPFNAPWAGAVTACCVAVLLAGFALRLGWYGFAPWHSPFAETRWIEGKEDLALPRVLHALALAWLVAAFVPRDAGWMHASAIAWVAPIGRFSLEVFCLGLFLSWIASTALRLAPSGWHGPLDPILIAAGFFALFRFARALDRRRFAVRVA
jgi:hypothetical protein